MSILQLVKTEIEVFGPIKAKAHATMKCAELMSSSEKITMAQAHRLIGYVQTGNETYLDFKEVNNESKT